MGKSTKTSTPLFDAVKIQERFKELNPRKRQETMIKQERTWAHDRQNYRRRYFSIKTQVLKYHKERYHQIQDEMGYHHDIALFYLGYKIVKSLQDAKVVEIKV